VGSTVCARGSIATVSAREVVVEFGTTVSPSGRSRDKCSCEGSEGGRNPPPSGLPPSDRAASGGAQTADPHERGHGPLKAGDPIILDIFPADKTTRYYADMTRTFVKGEPGEELQKMYDAVLESQEAALAMIGPGVNGRDIHKKVSDILHEAGYKTLVHDQRPGEPLQEGFIHGTGHGVGLEIHESPRVSIADEKLIPGDVVTIEPGLYYRRIGGIRIEDLVVVTENGCRNLTNFPKEFRI